MTMAEVRAERLRMNKRAKTNTRIETLQNALADARRDTALLTGLVERMGEDLEYHLYKNEDAHCPGIPVGPDQHYAPYTVIGQREYDAAMHDAEGEPETRESTGAWGYE